MFTVCRERAASVYATGKTSSNQNDGDKVYRSLPSSQHHRSRAGRDHFHHPWVTWARTAPDKTGTSCRSLSALMPATCRRQSSIVARTRSVNSAAVTLQSNGTEISSKSLLRGLPAATMAASSSVLRSRGIVSESKSRLA
jgi:hypothetical protein